MFNESLSQAIAYAAIASVVMSFITLVCIVYFKRSKTSYNEEARRVEMDVMRSAFEEKIFLLTERMQKNPARWRDVNHLIFDASAKVGGKGSIVGGIPPQIDPHRFFEELGIDVGSLKVIENQVFVLTPFHVKCEETYQTVKSACALNNLVAVRGDESFKAGNILRHIIEQILISPYIVANINGRNPNVHYELGIAHSLGKKILLLSEGIDDMAYDLQSERVLVYGDQKDLNVKLYVYFTKLLSGK